MWIDRKDLDIISAGFTTDKSILNMQMEDLLKIPSLTAVETNIIIEFKKAIKNKQIIAFLSGELEKGKINSEKFWYRSKYKWKYNY